MRGRHSEAPGAPKDELMQRPTSELTGSHLEVSGAGPHLAATLNRILVAVEQERRQGSLELALVILLGLTALGSTWCAYQSQLWNGVQLARFADADLATQHANENRLAALQRKTLHGMVLLHFFEARQRNDLKMAEAMLRRMESPLRETIDAWLKLDPLNNPDAPHPTKMPQYVLVEDQRAQEAQENALALRAAAQQAGNNGDTYVLLTLLFASVLFFGGMTGTFRSRRVRLGMGGIACVLFLTTAIRLAFMPVTG